MSVKVYVDVGDIYHKLHRHHNAKLDYELFLDYIDLKFGRIDKATAYGSQRDCEATGFITCLQNIGFDTKYKRPRIFRIGDHEIKRCDWGVEISIDTISDVQVGDTVILGVSNIDYIPLINFLKNFGVRVVIIASSVPNVMCKVADEVIEITENLFEEKP